MTEPLQLRIGLLMNIKDIGFNKCLCIVVYIIFTQEFQLLPKLARSQPIVDKAKLASASSVEEALEIAQAALQS